jgi:capsular exopolysaccharide synthesis family protein
MEAVNTHALIQERISVIHDELSEVEEGIASFKQVEGLTKYETDLQYNNQSAERYEQQLVEAETELKIARSLYEQINDTANLRKPVPLNVGLTDPLLKATVREYNRLLLEYERLSKSMTSENPAMVRLQEKIAGLRQNMETSLNSQLTELNIKRRDAANQSKLYSGRVGRIPTQERVFRDISRQQQFKSNLYLMLLKKREEIFWMLSATANRAKVIDEAFISGMVSPRTKIIWLASLLTGVLFPAVLLYLIEVIRFKVRSREDVDRLCEVAVLAEIPEHKEMGSIAVKEDGGEETDEAFRFLRTQLMLSMHPGQKVVTCTSTISGEGKTFTAINTAISMALLGKKVLLVGMDLRIPRLREHLKLATNRGITLYLAGFEKEIENLIVPSGIHSNLDVLPSGPVPPNPAELMGRPTLESAFETLRRLYDYIIVDSAPSGSVGDTLIMNRVTDVTLYLCRVGYSRKSNLRYANELMQSGKLSNMLLVVNDVKEYQQKYGYGYGYGYKEKKKTGKIQKLSRV